jgi:hypothetical protein
VFALPWSGDIASESQAQSEAGQLLICGTCQARRQNFLGGSLVAFVISGEVFRDLVGEGVGIKVDEGAEEYPQLRGGKHRRGVFKDAVEGGFAGFRYLSSAVALGLDLRLLLLELLLALLLRVQPILLPPTISSQRPPTSQKTGWP